MSDTKVYISDINSIVELNRAFEYSSDGLRRLAKEIDEYLDQQMNEIRNSEKQLESLLQEAEGELKKAQEAVQYSASEEDSSGNEDEANDKYGENDGESVSHALVDTQRRVEEIRECLEKVKRIVSDCEKQFESYNKRGQWDESFGDAGARYVLEKLNDYLAPKAKEKLDQIVDTLDTYTKLSASESSGYSSSVPLHHTAHQERLDNAEKSLKEMSVCEHADEEKDYMEAHTISLKETVTHAKQHNVHLTENEAICPNCFMPISLCVCKKTE